jgi:uncharacterized membrane protein YgaE (UPF0421/DUF939 family)
MLMMQSNSITTGTLGGTVLCMVPHISSDDLSNTIILAAVGASVSYLVSYLWKRVLEKHRKNDD